MKSIPSILTKTLAAICLFGLLGCGGGDDDFPTAPVSGKVSYNGQAVKGGTLTFAPIPKKAGENAGKAASATVGDDGTYTLTTYKTDDGAVIGKHKISYSPPPDAGSESPAEGQHAKPKPNPYAGLKPKQAEVEVEDKKNEINIDLTK